MQHEEPEAPTGLPYTGRVSEHGHPWEQAEEQSGPSALPEAAPVTEPMPAVPAEVVAAEPARADAPAPAAESAAPAPAEAPRPGAPPPPVAPPPPGGQLVNTPVGEHGSLAGSAWDQRARNPIPFSRTVLLEARKFVATTTERVLLGSAVLVLLAVTLLAATQVNQTGPTGPAFQIFGLVLACQIAPVALYAVVLRTVRAEWYYRTAELTLVHRPGRQRLVAAQLVALLPLWPLIALLQAVVYLLAKPALPAPWVLAVAFLGALLSALFVLAIGLLVPNPALAVGVYVVLSVLYVVRVRNPLVLRWFDPWQPASKLAGSVPEPLPSLTSTVLLVAVVVLGFALARRR